MCAMTGLLAVKRLPRFGLPTRQTGKVLPWNIHTLSSPLACTASSTENL